MILKLWGKWWRRWWRELCLCQDSCAFWFSNFCTLRFVFYIFSLQSVEMPQLEAGYYVEVQTWISYLCPPLCRVRRRGASPLDPSFMLLLYIWTLGYIRLPYLGALISFMFVIVAFPPTLLSPSPFVLFNVYHLLLMLLLLLIMAVRLWVATVSGAGTKLIPCQ